MTRRPLIAIFALISAIVAISPAHAQQQTPAFSLPGVITSDEVAALSVDFDESFAMIENQYLADTLKLNYQISLLEKLVAREAELGKIAESYDAMGVAFSPPPPPRGICAQLPANAPCLKYHPDLYDALVDERKAYYEELAERARRAAEPPRKEGETDKEAEARRKKEEAEKAAKAAARERDNRYRWTEVTCSGQNCHGVLVTSANDGYRATVREGDRLNDGTVVQAITTRGIRVAIEGQVVNVRPAPGEGASEDGLTGEAAELANKLEQTMANSGISGSSGSTGPLSEAQVNAQTQAASGAAASVVANATADGSSTAGTGDAAGQTPAANSAAGAGGAGQSTMEPALGPSGLF